MERKNFENWTTEEIYRQLEWLTSLPEYVIFSQDKALAFGDGVLEIATFGEDKSWSDWESYLAPNLHIPEGRLIFDCNIYDVMLPIIRISTNEALEFCHIDAPQWSKNEILNIHNQGHGKDVINEIYKGNYGVAAKLTTRTTNPCIHIQLDILSKIENKKGYFQGLSIDAIYEAADVPYQSNEWVEYYPFVANMIYWVPAQEIAYLKELIQKRKKKEAKEAKQKAKAAGEISKKTTSSSTKHTKPSGKDYRVAALLAIVLGSFGAHKFYMGKYLVGILYLIFFWSWLPAIVGILEGIFLFMGGQEKFDEKLENS